MIAAAAYAAPGGWGYRFHGLTPTAKCGRRIRGLLEPPGWRPGDCHLKFLSAWQCCDLGESGEAAVGVGDPAKRRLQGFLIERRSRGST